MNKVAIAFLTKDRVELSKQSVQPLIQPDKFDLCWFDGSDTAAGQDLPFQFQVEHHHANVRGGADAAIVYALTELLKHDYTHIALVENDVLLHSDWFGPTMALFDRARSEGLEAGAVAARCYVDRILCQRDGYALMHNLGAGQIIFTRQAAQLILKNYRTPWTLENRRVFAQLSGIDIGSYWAFRANTQWLTVDWGHSAVLASQGLASLALVPSPVEMIGQRPSLAEQGLKLATEPVEDRRDDNAFGEFAFATKQIRDGALSLSVLPVRFRGDDGCEQIFAHQLEGLRGADWEGDWRLKWSQGLGGFAAKGHPGASFECFISGPCRLIVLGGEKGGQVEVVDLRSNYTVRPTLMPEASNQITQVAIPCTVSWRPVRLTVLSGTCIFYGIQCSEPQPVVSGYTFDHSKLWDL